MSFQLPETERLNYKISSLEFKITRQQLKTDETVIVNTKSGKVKGVKRYNIYDDGYFSFERIPYAQPPVGDLRFRAPRPIAPWKEVRDCTFYGPKPIQQSLENNELIEGSENCLHLNIYTNNLTPIKSRPVMVWIYGGGFTFGEANPETYGPEFFIKKDVVLVTVQYRLGALGFLSLKDPTLHTPGNAGLKDQILALKWIKRNCATFGGNPECITLFGESAGGASTHLLMLSDQSKGLFQRAILQSGDATCDWLNLDTTDLAYRLAKTAGYTGENVERDILKYLLDCSASKIVEAQINCVPMEENIMIAFTPCIEPYITQHTVLTKNPKDMLKYAWGNSIPLMVGATSKEGLYLASFVENFPELWPLALETCSSFVPRDAHSKNDNGEKGFKIRKLHVNGNKPTADEFYDIFSIAHFWHPLHKSVRERLQYARKTPTYLYRFDFIPKYLINILRLTGCGRNAKGAAHGDDLGYLFTSATMSPVDATSMEYKVMETMIDLWTTFAETGNPNSRKSKAKRDIDWRPLNKQDDVWKCLNIGNELQVIDLPEMEKLKAWQELYDNLEIKPTNEVIDLSVYSKSAL